MKISGRVFMKPLLLFWLQKRKKEKLKQGETRKEGRKKEERGKRKEEAKEERGRRKEERGKRKKKEKLFSKLATTNMLNI